MNYRCSERIAYGFTMVEVVCGTQVLPTAFEKAYGTQLARQYDQLARAMALVATPYAPCTDLPKELM